MSHKRWRLTLWLCLALTLLPICAWSDTVGPVNPPLRSLNSELTTDNSQLIELFRLRLVNEQHGEIAVSADGGVSWRKLGEVLHPCEKVEPLGFTASKWIDPVRVAATAVNAIHVTTDYDPQTDRASVFSMVPRGGPTSSLSFYSPQAAITTSFAGGAGIFGGGYAPFVGDRLSVERQGELFQAEKGYVPARGDILTIIVERFLEQPTQLVFQNREGGLIYLQFPDGSRRAIGKVIRPVKGIGRFGGGIYAAVGRIRANHPGVIDVSVSPLGKIGGFQIIPEHHAHSPEMGRALTMTQWMIVAPLPPLGFAQGGVSPHSRGNADLAEVPPRNGKNEPTEVPPQGFRSTTPPIVGEGEGKDTLGASEGTQGPAEPLPENHWEGVPPLFYGFIRPDYRPDDLYTPDWQERFLSRFLVEMRTADGPWQPFPALSLDPDVNKALPEWANTALAEVSEIRILFPVPSHK